MGSAAVGPMSKKSHNDPREISGRHDNIIAAERRHPRGGGEGAVAKDARVVIRARVAGEVILGIPVSRAVTVLRLVNVVMMKNVDLCSRCN